ncbi:class I adenylate-forming enzyme family protein [Streptomyces violaceusniger]|uniref:class I adenylate-forming enzyme family protein n=1 Tax=Streptomyces violaceusniger TaxID=68280 RepID=UPI000997C19A|nr:class I adenylate-forming enzyme family protein [Streptomyces hygroscopicus]AQW48646.1 fatty-acid--CoA ligase [Streptomyces hygroscopicus]
MTSVAHRAPLDTTELARRFRAPLHGLEELPAGARVVIRLPHGESLAGALLTCFDLGLVAVPRHPRSSDAELADTVRRVDASAVIDASRDRAQALRARILPGAPADPGGAGLAFIMFTSGSTGTPKGVMLSRRAVLGNATKTARLHRFAPGRPHGTCLPLYHCNALVMSLIGTHITHTPLVLHTAFDPEGYLRDLAAGGARTASIVPALLTELVEAGPGWPDGLDYLITAAAPLTGDLARRFHRRYGPRLRQGYGLTEAVNFSFTMPVLTEEDFLAQYLDRFPPVGLPLPGTEVRLASGEVWIRTPDMMDGYWRDQGGTAETLTPDGWLRTGDLGEFRDGLLVLRGRAKERIDRGGEKHYPLDVERMWHDAGLRGRFAAVPVAESTLGHEVGLVIDEPAATTLDAVRTVCEQAALRPAAVRWGGFLATATGKPQRTAMGGTLAVRRISAVRYERLLRYAAATARTLLATGPTEDAASWDLDRAPHRDPHRDPHRALRAIAPYAADEPAPTGDEPAFAAFDFLRAHVRENGIRTPLPESEKARWRAYLRSQWPLSEYAELAAEIVKSAAEPVTEDGVPAAPGPVEFGARWESEDGTLRLLPHAPATPTHASSNAPTHVPTTADGTPWALDYLWRRLADDHGTARADRWTWMRRPRPGRPATVGFSVLRAGRHDLGGVVWDSQPRE